MHSFSYGDGQVRIVRKTRGRRSNATTCMQWNKKKIRLSYCGPSQSELNSSINLQNWLIHYTGERNSWNIDFRFSYVIVIEIAQDALVRNRWMNDYYFKIQNPRLSIKKTRISSIQIGPENCSREFVKRQINEWDSTLISSQGSCIRIEQLFFFTQWHLPSGERRPGGF